MWERIRVIFTIPELRQKILLTLFLLAIYRIGWQIQLPVIDQAKVSQFAASQSGGGFGKFVEYAAVFSASRLSQVTIFGLGIMPYISASIIFQLLGSVWKPLEELQKEGESGRKKINEYTRYATVVLCLIQSAFYVRLYVMAQGGDLVHESFKAAGGNLTMGWQITSVLMMTCGTVFLMWLGEQIDEFGIGNGISLLIMAGILAQMPSAGYELLSNAEMELVGLFNGKIGIEALLILAVLFVLVVFGVVFITLGQRRIPTQSAKHVRGRRVYGGSRQYLPMRINQAGVMPIIFAGSLLMFPSIIFTSLGQWIGGDFGNGMAGLGNMLSSPTALLYNLVYVVMIYFFCYFWTAIMFNPKDMADNLKTMGTFIPGYRPGKRTADYLEQVMVRITYVGAGFLALVAIIPSMIAGSLGVSFMVASFYGGTGLLIAVSVAFDLVQKIDSHLVMRNYSGLLES